MSPDGAAFPRFPQRKEKQIGSLRKDKGVIPSTPPGSTPEGQGLLKCASPIISREFLIVKQSSQAPQQADRTLGF